MTRMYRWLGVASFMLLAACSSAEASTPTAPSADPENGGAWSPETEGKDADEGTERSGSDAAGAANAEVVVTAPAGLDFGTSDCGSAPSTRLVRVQNLGSAEITFTAAMTKAEAFTVAPASGAVPSGRTLELTVSSSGVPAGGPPGARSDELTVTTSAPEDVPHVLEATLLASGAVFTVSPFGTFDFGPTTITKTKTIKIRNDGNAPGTISFSVPQNVPGSFEIYPSTPATIAPGAEVERSVRAHPPTAGPPQKTGTLTFSSTSVLCGPMPSSIALRAWRND